MDAHQNEQDQMARELAEAEAELVRELADIETQSEELAHGLLRDKEAAKLAEVRRSLNMPIQ